MSLELVLGEHGTVRLGLGYEGKTMLSATKELDRIAKQEGVRTLLSFCSFDADSWGLLPIEVLGPNRHRPRDGIRTIRAIQNGLAASDPFTEDLRADVEHMLGMLEVALHVAASIGLTFCFVVE